MILILKPLKWGEKHALRNKSRSKNGKGGGVFFQLIYLYTPIEKKNNFFLTLKNSFKKKKKL